MGESNRWECQTQTVSGNITATPHIKVYAQSPCCYCSAVTSVWNYSTWVLTSCVASACEKKWLLLLLS